MKNEMKNEEETSTPGIAHIEENEFPHTSPPPSAVPGGTKIEDKIGSGLVESAETLHRERGSDYGALFGDGAPSPVEIFPGVFATLCGGAFEPLFSKKFASGKEVSHDPGRRALMKSMSAILIKDAKNRTNINRHYVLDCAGAPSEEILADKLEDFWLRKSDLQSIGLLEGDVEFALSSLASELGEDFQLKGPDPADTSYYDHSDRTEPASNFMFSHFDVS